MAAIGSPDWVAETNGALGLRDQVRFVAQAIVRELAPRHRGGAVLAVDRTPPSTVVAQHVTDFARTVLPAPLLHHSMRSWLWACMLADLDRIEYDDERLYVAALLHDVALSDSHRPGPAAACFAVHGATVARDVVIGAGGGAAFADDVADAIAAHFNVAVPLSWGAEAHLLHAGTHLDVVGLRRLEIARSSVDEVHAREPRAGFAGHFLAVMREEGRLRKSSRAGLLWRLGMERSVRRAERAVACEDQP
ncbi:cyanamide hydratase family protein with HD domain [Kribbella pratensis]|uniref:Cyanamide hydratase family protein with HD domain n=1 Tax=Kribbella pratensis TaxID=2512112 RepID=A0ABY2FHQ6_9ACTN|nr:HD domain-containing protein [Kribbella pratensis]TDW90904.1 cyanamide hydratase family protein with HD domain [Kribbella pratensis]